jgi:hypothetical protein
MQRTAGVLALLLVASPARADTLRKVEALWEASQEGEIRRKVTQVRDQIEASIALADAFLDNNAPIDARVDVIAEAGAGIDDREFAAQGTAAIVFAVRQERCDLLQAGLSIRGDLRSRSPHTLGGMQQWAEICLSGGLDFGPLEPESTHPGMAVFPLVLRESALMLARPRLTAPRAAIDEAYSDIGYGFDVEGLRYRWREHNGLAFIGFSADQRWRWRHFYGGEESKSELTADIWIVRLFHTRGETALADRYIDTIVVGLHGIQADNGAAIVNFWPVRISGLGLFSDSLLLDAEWGIGGTGTISSETSGPGANNMTTIETTDLPDVTAGVAHAALHVGDVYRAVSAAYDRTVDTNVLADVIVEDRFTLSAQRTEPVWLARGAAFVSRAKYFLDEDTRAEERVLGFAFSGSYKLPRELDLGLTLEGVFGLHDRDPVLDGHALPRGLRMFVTLGTTKTIWSY